MTVTIWHNPACGTSRNALAMIRASGEEPVVIEYLEQPPTRERLAGLIAAAGLGWTPIAAAAFATLVSLAPEGVVPAVAGLALMGTLAASLRSALAEPSEQVPAVVTFAVAAIGAALHLLVVTEDDDILATAIRCGVHGVLAEVPTPLDEAALARLMGEVGFQVVGEAWKWRGQRRRVGVGGIEMPDRGERGLPAVAHPAGAVGPVEERLDATHPGGREPVLARKSVV